MCSSCKKSGQWDMIQSFLASNKKTKKWKTFQNNQEAELEHLKEILVDINNSTKELKKLENSDLSDILRKFSLPVCITITSLGSVGVIGNGFVNFRILIHFYLFKTIPILQEDKFKII